MSEQTKTPGPLTFDGENLIDSYGDVVGMRSWDICDRETSVPALAHAAHATQVHDELIEACKKALTCASLNSDVRDFIAAASSFASAPVPRAC